LTLNVLAITCACTDLSAKEEMLLWPRVSSSSSSG